MYLFGHKTKSKYLILLITICEIMGPIKDIVKPKIMCILGLYTFSLNNTALIGAAKSVCIKKIIIVYFDKKDCFLINVETIQIIEKHAIIPKKNNTKPLLISTTKKLHTKKNIKNKIGTIELLHLNL